MAIYRNLLKRTTAPTPSVATPAHHSGRGKKSGFLMHKKDHPSGRPPHDANLHLQLQRKNLNSTFRLVPNADAAAAAPHRAERPVAKEPMANGNSNAPDAKRPGWRGIQPGHLPPAPATSRRMLPSSDARTSSRPCASRSRISWLVFLLGLHEHLWQSNSKRIERD